MPRETIGVSSREDTAGGSIDFSRQPLQLGQIDGECQSQNVDWIVRRGRPAVYDMVPSVPHAFDDPLRAISTFSWIVARQIPELVLFQDSNELLDKIFV